MCSLNSDDLQLRGVPSRAHKSQAPASHGLCVSIFAVSKTNACRILDSLGIHYETRDYTVDPNDLAAESVAAKINMPAEQVFKTLAVRGDRNGVFVAVIPGNYELDFKALAQLTGDRKIEMVLLKDVLNVTGYIRGGVTALGMKKDYPVFIDETMQLWDLVSVSAGQRGTQIILAPDDYVKAVSGKYGEISRPKA
jgi:Cys-tRNA(Pro)/Cys-tRNA(Cys) deacylase